MLHKSKNCALDLPDRGEALLREIPVDKQSPQGNFNLFITANTLTGALIQMYDKPTFFIVLRMQIWRVDFLM